MGFFDNMRYQMGNAIGLPRPNNMAAGRRAERSVPMPSPEQSTALIQAMRAQKEADEAQRNQPMAYTAMGDYTGMGPAMGAPTQQPPMGPHTMADARQQEIAARNANPLVPQTQKPAAPVPAGGGGSPAFTPGAPANVPLPPPRPADLGGNGQQALYYLDPGDGGILRQYLSKDGSAPNFPGYTAFKDDSYNPNAGILNKLLRGVF